MNKEEFEILLIALTDFRLKNQKFNLFEDSKIRQLIFKLVKEVENG